MRNNYIIKSTFKKIAYLTLVMLLGITCLTACGGEPSAHFSNKASANKDKNSDKDDDSKVDNSIYIVQELNMIEETITVYNTETTRTLRYNYSLATRFLDKYGEESSSLNFVPGTAVVLGDKMKSTALSSVQMSDETWTQTDVTNYKVDSANYRFSIGNQDYLMKNDVSVFTGNESISPLEIGKTDTLTVVGKGNSVLSIAVTTGHGYIQFLNTTNFEGSMVQIGSKIFTKLTADLMTEVPEGEYQVTVANNGYGGTVTANVKRGQITTVDLGQFQQGGPKTCQVTFKSSTSGIVVTLDGVVVGLDTPITVAYGAHSIKVSAPGYDEWSKTMYVNSANATIVIDMDADNDTSATNSTSNSSKSNSTSISSNTTNAASTKDSDYLSTISNMISTITGTSTD